MDGKNLKRFGIILIVVTGIVHFIEAPEYFEEAAYMGALFVLNGIGSLAAAYGIYKNQKRSWVLGLLIAGGSIIGYIVSRTNGMPGVAIKEWADAIGILSLVVETLFVLISVKVLTGKNETRLTFGAKTLPSTARRG